MKFSVANMVGYHNASLWIVVALICIAMSAIACSSGSSSNQMSGSTSADDSASDSGGITTDEVLERARQRMIEAGSLYFTLEHENGFTEALGGLELQHVEGSVNETASMVTAEANLGRVFIVVDAILIGADTWFTNPLTGEWELMDEEQNPIGFLEPIVAIKDILNGLTDPQFTTPPEPGTDYIISSPIPASELTAFLLETIPDSVGDAVIVIDSETFETKSAQITGALQVRDNENTLRIIHLTRYGETFEILPPQ